MLHVSQGNKAGRKKLSEFMRKRCGDGLRMGKVWYGQHCSRIGLTGVRVSVDRFIYPSSVHRGTEPSWPFLVLTKTCIKSEVETNTIA